jgi:phage-related protein
VHHEIVHVQKDLNIMKNLIWIIVAAVIAIGGYMLYSGQSVQEMATEAADAVNAPEALESATAAVGDAVEATEGAVAEAVDATAEAASAATDAVSEAATAASDTASGAVDAMTETANDAADATADAASDAATAASETATTAMDATSEAASDAATAASETATAAMDATTEAASDAATAVEDTAAEAADTMSNMATEATDAVQGSAMNATEQAEANVEAPVVTAQTDTTVAMADASPEELTTVEGFDLEKVQAMIDESSLPDMQKTLFKRGLASASDNPEALQSILARVRTALNL